MRPDAYLVNTARAGAVDMPALRSALARGRIAGAALDVFDVEPLPADDPLRHLDQVTLTNHRGSDTYNSYADSPRMVAEQARRFFAGERPDFLANPELFPHLREVEP
jgi:D-3-phosphoglycerate dehydrogenase